MRQFVPSRNRLHVKAHAAEIERHNPEKKIRYLREHDESKPPAGIEGRKWAPWSIDKIKGFERGVIALGWSDWAGIAC